MIDQIIKGFEKQIYNIIHNLSKQDQKNETTYSLQKKIQTKYMPVILTHFTPKANTNLHKDLSSFVSSYP